MFKSWVSIALLISFVVGQAMSAVDSAENTHQVCADHGEIIHGEPATQSASSTKLPTLSLPSEEAAHIHDHCAYTLIRSGAHQAHSSQNVLERLDSSVFTLQFEVARTQALQVLFRLAPKNSPPASA